MRGRDYGRPGGYFVTILLWDRTIRFGNIRDAVMYPNEIGQIVENAWRWLATYPSVRLDGWCLMPDHFHGIVTLTDASRTRDSAACSGSIDSHCSETAQRIKPLSQLIGAFKTVSTKEINLLRGTPGRRVWHRSYWDHIIRDDADLHRVRRYIRENPANWTRPRRRVPGPR